MLDKESKELFKRLFFEIEKGQKLYQLSEIKAQGNSKGNDSDIKILLLNIEREGLIDVIFTDHKGEPYVYLTLKQKGVDFFADKRKRRKEFLFRILFAGISALVTYFMGKILYNIFK